jgi:hypothetical protein
MTWSFLMDSVILKELGKWENGKEKGKREMER